MCHSYSDSLSRRLKKPTALIMITVETRTLVFPVQVPLITASVRTRTSDSQL